jgi:CheY-like chemotaxis protein
MDVLAREAVALVLLDHELPDMTAPELLEALRSQNRAIPPVVLMTALQHPKAGATSPELVEVLQKPFDLSDLAGVLNRHLPRR